MLAAFLFQRLEHAPRYLRWNYSVGQKKKIVLCGGRAAPARRTALNHFDSDDVPVMKVGLYFCSNLGKLRLKHGGTES